MLPSEKPDVASFPMSSAMINKTFRLEPVAGSTSVGPTAPLSIWQPTPERTARLRAVRALLGIRPLLGVELWD
jgi:hypothetical protein